jgi:dihydroxynaphthoic acid synthetase
MTAVAEHTYTHILYGVDAGVATVTINRPEKLNAFTPHTICEMTEAVVGAGHDPSVGVIVITGAGERAFSAGGDVEIENEDVYTGAGDQADGFRAVVSRLYAAIRDSLKPVIARVDGYAIGGGHHMAYMCDLTIASDRSIFGQNGPRVASPAEGWLVAHLWTVVGMKRAKEIWLMCRRYSAQQALEWGLINASVPADQLDIEVRKWADELLALSPTVLKILKKSFDDSLASTREQMDRFEILTQVNPGFYASGEQTEGATAFMEKRTPDFSQFR